MHSLEREEILNRIKNEIKKYDVVTNTENEIVLCDNLNKSGLIAHNIMYRRISIFGSVQIERQELFADLTEKFEFFLKSVTYGVLNEEFKEVELEKSSSYETYEYNMFLLNNYFNKDDIFPLFKELQKREDLLIKRESKYVCRIRSNGYGVDEVVDSGLRRVGGVSSSCISLDSVFENVEEIHEKRK